MEAKSDAKGRQQSMGRQRQKRGGSSPCLLLLLDRSQLVDKFLQHPFSFRLILSSLGQQYFTDARGKEMGR